MYRSMGADLASGEQILIADAPAKPRASYSCPNQSGACITVNSEKDVRKRANDLCGRMTAVRGVNTLGAVTCNTKQIGVGNDYLFDPCWVKTLPTCKPPSVSEPDRPIITTTAVPPVVQDDEDSEDSAYVVGGILALLAVGGIAYAVMKRKKKGKR